MSLCDDPVTQRGQKGNTTGVVAANAPDRLLSADDVAALLGIGKDWIYAEVRAGRIPHVKLGRYVRFRSNSIEEWIAGLERGNMAATTKRRGDGLQPPPGMAPEG